MGDVADMMIDGLLCEQCGVYMGGAVGHPRNCGCDPELARDQRKLRRPLVRPSRPKPYLCECGKRSRTEASILTHTKAKHPEWPEPRWEKLP